MPVATAELSTADDVRRHALAVVRRARARDQNLKRQAALKLAVVEKPPEPDPVPNNSHTHEPKPEPARALLMSEEQLKEWILENESAARAVLARIDDRRELEAIERRPLVGQILGAVCKTFGISRDDIASDRRTKEVIAPRQIAMLLARTLTGRSLPEIGRYLGGKDHTTVLYAVRKLDWLKQKLEAELTSADPPEMWALRALQHYCDATGMKAA